MRRSGFSKKKSDKDKELEKLYGIKMTYWRYKGHKGIYWNLISQYVRRRDFFKYGTCISCKRQFGNWHESQAGHYAPAGNCGWGLLFDPQNIHAECPACNNPRISPGKLIPYRANLVQRYGEAYVKRLDRRYAEKNSLSAKEWTQREYDVEIRKLIKKLQKMPD